MDLTALKDFLDLGSTFCLSIAILYLVGKKLDKIDEALDKVLAILLVLTKGLYGGNPISDILKKDKKELKEMLNSE